MKNNKEQKILGRLNKDLENGDLREYLINKNETSFLANSIEAPDLVDYKICINNPKVLLIGNPITIPKYMQKRCIPPLGISYVAAALEKAKINVSVIDCCVEGWDIERYSGNLVTYGLPPEQLTEKLSNCNFDVVGLSVLFSTDLQNLYETSVVVKNALPNCVIVVGGLHSTIYPKEIFELDLYYNKKRTIDFVIRGEGEERFVNFINLLKKGKINKNADGLVGFIDNDKNFIFNHQLKTIENIDKIPFPAFHLLPMEKYFKINVPFSPVPQGDRVLPMLTTRGCPIGCTFCANTNTWKKHRKRSIDNIIQELDHWKKLYNFDEIQFADDNLTFDMDHSIKKFNAMAKKDLKLLWCTPNGTMIDKLTEELIQAMSDSGMYQITLSLDSANTRTLKELHRKPVNLNSIPGLIKKCRELSIFTHGTLVVGMPGETIDEIESGFEYVKKYLDFTSVSVFIAAAIPGSELYHQMLKEGRITKQDARLIDTTKLKISLSNIDPEKLEKKIEEFQSEFLEIVKNNFPEEYKRKYNKLINSGRWDEKQIGGKLT